MKHQHTGMLVMCLVMLGAGLLWMSQGIGNSLWLLLLMPVCMAAHLLLHRKVNSEHEKKPPE